ncbi:hypothetical protein Ddc_24204 [Ditylenchus destructor]|nr:hypothetical protein Ddc_24204 [Ditylenchus destructor]
MFWVSPAAGKASVSSVSPVSSLSSLQQATVRVLLHLHQGIGRACDEAAHHVQQVGTRQRQLAREFVVGQRIAIDLAAGRENAQRNGQVEAPRILGQTGVQQRRAHAFTRFLDLDIARPTSVNDGRPLARCTSTVTRGAASPNSARTFEPGPDPWAPRRNDDTKPTQRKRPPAVRRPR